MLGSWHTELGAYAGLRSGAEDARERGMDMALVALLPAVRPRALAQPGQRRVAGAARASTATGSAAGAAGSTPRASTRRCATRHAYPGEIKVLYAGRLTKEKGVDLLADAFLRAREADPRLHLLLAGGGAGGGAAARAPRRARDLPRLARRRGAAARLRERRHLPLLQPHRHLRPGPRRGRASGLPVVAVDEGGPASIVIDGETGRLCEPDPGDAGRGACSSSPMPRPGAPSSAARAWRRPRAPHLGGGDGPAGRRLRPRWSHRATQPRAQARSAAA